MALTLYGSTAYRIMAMPVQPLLAVEETLANITARAEPGADGAPARLPPGHPPGVVFQPEYARAALLMPAHEWALALGKPRPQRLLSLEGFRHRRRVHRAKRILREHLREGGETVDMPTRAEIARALTSAKSQAEHSYRNRERTLDGHYVATSRMAGPVRISVRRNRAGMEEVSLSVPAHSRARELTRAIVDRVVEVHRETFGAGLRESHSESKRDGTLAWVVMHVDEQAERQEALFAKNP